MKHTLAKLHAIALEIEDKIEQRENYFDTRSDKWHESEKSAEHDERTEHLRNAFDYINDAISDLDEFLNN